MLRVHCKRSYLYRITANISWLQNGDDDMLMILIIYDIINKLRQNNTMQQTSERKKYGHTN